MPETRARLKTLRDGLLRLHLILLENAKEAYERDVKKIENRGQYLNLVLGDPWFAWLRELSQLVVLIDETIARKDQPATPADAERLIAQARALISPEEGAQGFQGKYDAAMQDNPDVIFAHRDMMQVFAGLNAEGA
jgi:hypothetical protein